MTKIATCGPIMQMSWLCVDIMASITYWTQTMGVGPFVHVPEIKLDDCKFNGQPSDAAFQMAIAYSGDMQIELVQAINEEPSIYSGGYVRDADYLHHICMLTPDMDTARRDVLARGGEIAMEGSATGRPVIYVAMGDPGQPLLEILSPSDEQMGLFEMIRQAGLNWDGKDALLSLG